MEHSILQTVLWSYLICINIITIAVYGIDKRSAVRGKWRIRVSTLLGLAAAGGSVGALLGMHLFHHKTRKKEIHDWSPADAGGADPSSFLSGKSRSAVFLHREQQNLKEG